MRENSFLCVSRRKLALIFKKEFKLKSKSINKMRTLLITSEFVMSLIKLSEGSMSYRQKVLRILKQSENPLSVLAIQKRAGIGHWLSTKNILLELMLAGKVTCTRSGKALLFTIKKDVEK